MKNTLTTEFVNSIFELNNGKLQYIGQPNRKVGVKFITNGNEYTKLWIKENYYSDRYIIHLLTKGNVPYMIKEEKIIKEPKLCTCGCGEYVKNFKFKHFSLECIERTTIKREQLRAERNKIRYCKSGCGKMVEKKMQYCSKECQFKFVGRAEAKIISPVKNITSCILCSKNILKDSLFCSIEHEEKFNKLKEKGEYIKVFIDGNTDVFTNKYDDIVELRNKIINRHSIVNIYLHDYERRNRNNKFTQEEISLELLEESLS